MLTELYLIATIQINTSFRSAIEKRSPHDRDTAMKSEMVIATEEGRFYTVREARDGLAKFRGQRVPPSTLRDWQKILGIYPDDETKCFSPDQFALLARYAVWLKRGGLSKGFLTINNIQSGEAHEQRERVRATSQQQQWQRQASHSSTATAASDIPGVSWI
ncbi:MAG TPA: hypothetical protein V6C65_06830 [Allocoleopsis sp.]